MTIPQPAPDDDSRWIVLAQNGDVSAFEPLIERHLPCIRAFVAMKLPVSHLVNEVAHETFVFAFRNIRDFEAGTSLRAWLRAIAWNLVRQEILRHSREQKNLSRYAEAHLTEWTHVGEGAKHLPEVEFLEECLPHMPATIQRILGMKYSEGRTTEEIAGAMERSLEWVRVTLFRIRQQLRACIEGKMERSRDAT